VVETTRRREIEDVASSLFREHGYAGTSVRDIARALDIQGASLYAHVASKQDVLRTIVERMAGRFEAAADEAVAALDGGGSADPPSRLGAIVRAHVGVVTADLERATVFVHEWRSLADEGRTRMAKRRDAYERRFRTIVADGMETGAFASSDPTATAAFILTALNGLVAWYRPDGRLRPAEVADLYADLAVSAATGPEVIG
jgi:TetR/AcrR family transcriptional regulator, cholesterol catabolism regulator